MKINRKWLQEKKACSSGKEWFMDQGITEPILGLQNLIKHDKLDWANWLIVRVMTRQQYLAYAIFAAEQVIDIYEKKYPGKYKPLKAIEAAKLVLREDTAKNRKAAADAYAYATDAAYDAAYAAYATAYDAYAYATDAAYDAATAAYAYAAAYAAATAAATAAYAADAAYAAYATAAYAYAADATAAYDARKEMRIRILNYGISLLEKVAQEWEGAQK